MLSSYGLYFIVADGGKEHVGLKAVTEILQDIQYKVSHSLKENKNTG